MESGSQDDDNGNAIAANPDEPDGGKTSNAEALKTYLRAAMAPVYGLVTQKQR